MAISFLVYYRYHEGGSLLPTSAASRKCYFDVYHITHGRISSFQSYIHVNLTNFDCSHLPDVALGCHSSLI